MQTGGLLLTVKSQVLPARSAKIYFTQQKYIVFNYKLYNYRSNSVVILDRYGNFIIVIDSWRLEGGRELDEDKSHWLWHWWCRLHSPGRPGRGRVVRHCGTAGSPG